MDKEYLAIGYVERPATGWPIGEYKPSTCIRLDYHDGPCNGYPRVQCELKAELIREGKLDMQKANSHEQKEEAYVTELKAKFIRPWYKQVLAWVTGQL